MELILVNGELADFNHLLQDSDRVVVHPRFEVMEVTLLLRVRGTPLRKAHFRR